MSENPNLSLLMDLRPCFEGYAGIPQEARLLFSMFGRLGLRRLGGFVSGTHYTHRHNPSDTVFGTLFAQTRAVIAQDTNRQNFPIPLNFLPLAIRRRIFKPWMVLSEAFRSEKLNLRLNPQQFEDYLWTRLFEKTLPPEERAMMQHPEYYMAELGHEYARSLSLMPRFAQRAIRSEEWDIFFGVSVTPYRVAPTSATIVRYYDALPLLSPHTIGGPWLHALTHARLLSRNMVDGANFVCDSEPVRQDLLRLFPEREAQVRTIPVTVSPTLFPDLRPEVQVRKILDRRRSLVTSSRVEPARAPLPKLFLAVSTLEPRKNYLNLFRAFELAKSMARTPIQLVVVANKGWRSDLELAELRRLTKEGVFHLAGVPADELRVLYSAVHAVVAPSRAEGFDYSGAESMACGTPVIASDIPVHRWVYGDAADYFDPYSPEALARLIADYADLPRDTGHLAEQSGRGRREVRRYYADTLTPVWEQTLLDVTHSSVRTRTRSAPAMTN